MIKNIVRKFYKWISAEIDATELKKGPFIEILFEQNMTWKDFSYSDLKLTGTLP